MILKTAFLSAITNNSGKQQRKLICLILEGMESVSRNSNVEKEIREEEMKLNVF